MQKRNNQSGQVSLEFMLVVSIASLFFIVGVLALFGFIGDASEIQDKQDLKQLGDIIVDEVYIARSVENNYMREFELPKTLGGREYTIDIQHYNPLISNYSELTVRYTDVQRSDFSQYVIFLYKAKVNSIAVGTNSIVKSSNGEITITSLE